MALPPLIEPLPKSHWLPIITAVAKQTVAELDDRPSGKVLLRQYRKLKTDAEVYRWALELQCIPHSPYGNYLWACLVQIKNHDPQAAVDAANRVIKLGIGLSPVSGGFQSLAHIDPMEPVPPTPDPSVAKLPMGNFIDAFVSARYDISYRYRPGRSSTVLHLTYQDRSELDLDIFTICDSPDPAPMQSMLRAVVGPNQRLMPLRLGADTTPRLYKEKHKAVAVLYKDAEDFEAFVSIGLAGVMSNLPIGYLPGGKPPVAESRPRTTTPSIPETVPPPRAGDRGAPRPPLNGATRATDSTGTGRLTPANDNMVTPGPPKSTSPGSKSSAPPTAKPTRSAANTNQSVPSGAGYPVADGEVLGMIPGDQMPTSPPMSAPYGAAMEPPMAIIVRQRFPRSQFRFNTGRGNTGADVVWTGGEDPGFNIGDFKPDTPSGFAKFRAQVRRIWSGGPRAVPGKPFRAAMIGYRPDGTVYVVTVLKVTP
ncbi:hypothetical protein [Deinococcus aerophilus]|uniref:Uncharacterized protein n=1 Tax=Deinococcus aerophilus TaxID=522488 RepID=A0ABQ2GWZ6_9DEIO|nr:hypothetical protein [Deinococcus aerophilus]GGM16229.1 hypothetical protein GCM10010841_25720 [Deinococcus aerophilus]